MYLPCKYGKFSAVNGKRKVSFNPCGKVGIHAKKGTRENPFYPWTEPGVDIYSARFFVGLSVRQKPVYSMEDLVKAVRELRKKAKRPQDSSFVYQRGVFTHSEGKREVVEEDSAQVIIFKMTPSEGRGAQTLKQFQLEIEELCDALIVKLEQESIILEYQKNGVQYLVGEVRTA